MALCPTIYVKNCWWRDTVSGDEIIRRFFLTGAAMIPDITITVATIRLHAGTTTVPRAAGPTTPSGNAFDPIDIILNKC